METSGGPVGGIADPDSLADVIDAVRPASDIAYQRAQVRHRAVVPEERTTPGAAVAPPDDLPRLVDTIGVARKTSERPDVRHRTVVPEGAVRTRNSSNFPPVVDCVG